MKSQQGYSNSIELILIEDELQVKPYTLNHISHKQNKIQNLDWLGKEIQVKLKLRLIWSEVDE